MASYITATVSENSPPDAAMRGRPKNPVLATEIIRITPPMEARPSFIMRANTRATGAITRVTAYDTKGTRIRSQSSWARTMMSSTSAGSST